MGIWYISLKKDEVVIMYEVVEDKEDNLFDEQTLQMVAHFLFNK